MAYIRLKCQPFYVRFIWIAKQMQEINPILQVIEDLKCRTEVLRGYL